MGAVGTRRLVELIVSEVGSVVSFYDHSDITEIYTLP